MTMRTNLAKTVGTLGLITATLIFAVTDANAYTIYTESPNNYSAGTCNTNLENRTNTTSMIQNQLVGLGWNAIYWESVNAWPTDFMECSVPNGNDCTQTDAADLAIFRGHGQTNQLAFSNTNVAGLCNAAPGVNIELGRNSGAQAAMLITATCCVMNMHQPQNFTEHNGLNQQLGFGNLSSENTTMVNNFWWHSGNGGNNVGAWLSQMEDKPGWFTGDNTPVAFTRGSSSADAASNRNTCGLYARTCWARKGYNVGSAWQYDYYDHGCGGCNGC